MADEGKSRVQNIILENRRRLTVSGVEEVDGFDESSVQLRTALGELTVRGEGLHVDQLSVETGELIVTGEIVELVYAETAEPRGFFSRLFG